MRTESTTNHTLFGRTIISLILYDSVTRKDTKEEKEIIRENQKDKE